MAILTFVQPDSARITVDARTGISVMQAALLGGVAGIFAECGGNLACATCHVFVQEGGAHLPEPSEAETAMLEFTAFPRRPESRLSCQMTVTEELDGCVFAVAPVQL